MERTEDEEAVINSSFEYQAILDSDDRNARRRAIDGVASSEVWFEILESCPELTEDVAFNKHLPAVVLDRLIQHESPRVRSIVAMKHALSIEQFAVLADDAEESVRIMIANNKKTPLVVLDKLCCDSCQHVAIAAKARRQFRIG
jgi:hypothetical protein